MSSTNEIFLNEQERVFDEQVDMEAMRILLDNFDQIQFKLKLKINNNGYFKETTKDELFPRLQEFFIRKLKDTKIKVNFTNDLQVGRFFDNQSIQWFPREIRQTICKKLYWDLDIINCQAVIMENLILNMRSRYPSLKCENLQYYNTHRDSCLQFFKDNCNLSRDDAKQIFVSFLNGGYKNFNDLKKSFPKLKFPSYIEKIKSEIDGLFEALCEEDNEEVNRVKNHALDKIEEKQERGAYVSQLGTMISNYCQTQECKILSVAVRFLRSKGIKVSTPFFDGCHIYQDSFPKGETEQKFLIRDLEEHILKELNFSVRFKIKDMDEAVDISNFSVNPENDAYYIIDNFDYNNLANEFSHYNLAKIFSKYYPTSYLYNEKVWFEKNKFNIWEKRDDEPLSIRQNIHDFFALKISQKMSKDKIAQKKKEAKEKAEAKEEAEEANGEAEEPNGKAGGAKAETKKEGKGEAKAGKKKADPLQKLLEKLGLSTFKDGIIKELRGFYYKPDLFEKLDQNIHIFPFRNGKCIDLTTAELEVRPIREDDYVSLTCGYDYPETCDEQVKSKIKETFGKMFRETTDLDYALSTIASCLRGCNFFEKFFNFVGTGRNGKSLFFDACERVFGNFWGIVPIEWFYTYSSKDSSKGSAEMDRIVLSRVYYATEGETGNGERLAVDKVKRMTGGDKISYRAVYGRKQNSFTPKGTLFFNTNKILEVKTKVKKEVAFTERFICHKFPYTFKADVKTDDEFTKKADPTLKDAFKRDNRYRDALLHILIDYYKNHIFGKTSLTPPKSVLDATKDFINDEQNMLQEFLSDHKYTPGTEGKGESVDLYLQFLEHAGKTEKEITRRFYEEMMEELKFPFTNHSNYKHFIVQTTNPTTKKEEEPQTQSGKPPM